MPHITHFYITEADITCLNLALVMGAGGAGNGRDGQETCVLVQCSQSQSRPAVLADCVVENLFIFINIGVGYIFSISKHRKYLFLIADRKVWNIEGNLVSKTFNPPQTHI